MSPQEIRRLTRQMREMGCSYHVVEGVTPDPRQFQNHKYFYAWSRSFRDLAEAKTWAATRHDAKIFDNSGNEAR